MSDLASHGAAPELLRAVRGHGGAMPPDLLQRIEYRVGDEGDDNGPLRAGLADLLLHDFNTRDRSLLRELVAQETAARRSTDDGCGDTLYALCFMLYCVGEPEDCLLLHEAKHANFDAGCTIDSHMLTMRRRRAEMLAFLDERLGDAVPLPASTSTIRSDVEAAFDQPTYSTPEAFDNSMRHYFGLEHPARPASLRPPST